MIDPHDEFDPFEESESGSSEVLFQSSYGDFPKLLLYRGKVPLLDLDRGERGLWTRTSRRQHGTGGIAGRSAAQLHLGCRSRYRCR